MAFDFKLPSLGENIKTADVVKLLVAVGDTVAKDQPVAELETDKATIELPSPVAGVVKEIFLKEGGKATIGASAMTIEAGASAAAPAAAPAAKDAAAKDAAAPAAPAKMAPAAPAKAAQAVAAPAPVETAAAPVAASTPAPAPATPEAPGHPAPAAPSVRRFAREIGVDINLVKGAGPGGRISLEDVKAYAKGLLTGGTLLTPAAAAAHGTVADKLPDFSKWGATESVPMNNIRRATATHLTHAWQVIPHVTQFDKADITDLEALRKTFGKKVEAKGGKLTVTAILLKVVAAALRKFPQFNASVDMGAQAIVYKKFVNVGVAVDTDRGLLVPVLREVDKKNIITLAVELGQLAEKARTRKTSLEDMQGGSFTITNLGGIGGVGFTPIVNWPEVAILGVARGSQEPVWDEAKGQFVPRLMLPLALSYDHRLIDGADGARFLRWIVDALENPFLLSLEG